MSMDVHFATKGTPLMHSNQNHTRTNRCIGDYMIGPFSDRENQL